MVPLQPGHVVYDEQKREYKILDTLGKGGMGYVLLIQRIEDGEQYALKTLSVFMESESDGDYTALLNEGELAQNIVHKNVIKYEYFHNGKTYPDLPPYIIMELADKENLQDLINSRIASRNFLQQDELLEIYSMLIDGMEAINTTPLVHRDIKPANILVKDGVLKISDFGIAKIAGDPTRTKSFKGSGTIAYFPPEAFQNRANTVQMDIYSMGVVFYILATLKHPYEAEKKIITEDDWKRAHLHQVPASPQQFNSALSQKIYSVILKMLEKNPTKRFTTWQEIRSELATINKLTESVHSVTFEKIIAKTLEKNATKKKIELEEAQRREAEDQKREMIFYQFQNDIITPLQDFIKEFNLINTSPEERINFQDINNIGGYPSVDKAFQIDGNDHGWRVNISLRIIGQEDCTAREGRDPFGDVRRSVQEPLMRGKKVLAWGMVSANDRRGFNLVLVESENSDYGDWYLLENTHSGFSERRDGRPDPFPFDYGELRTEIYNIGVMHIYNINSQPLDMQKIFDLLTEL